MDVICTYKKRTLIVSIKGDIDHHSSEEIRTKIEKEYKRHNAKNILFDLQDVTFMDSSGLGLIIGRYKDIEKHGGQAAIVNTNSTIDRIMRMSGIYKIIQLYPDTESAFNILEPSLTAFLEQSGGLKDGL